MSTEQMVLIDTTKDRYPFCIVWTPIPILTWLFPIVGHMGIGMSNGMIRDFAGPYTVSEDNMAFGRPTKYWQLTSSKVDGGATAWDQAVIEASEIYKGRMHNLCCDNCHSYVATALNLMNYDNSAKWNMIKLALLTAMCSKYVSVTGFLKTWLPFVTIVAIVVLIMIFK